MIGRTNMGRNLIVVRDIMEILCLWINRNLRVEKMMARIVNVNVVIDCCFPFNCIYTLIVHVLHASYHSYNSTVIIIFE